MTIWYFNNLIKYITSIAIFLVYILYIFYINNDKYKHNFRIYVTKVRKNNLLKNSDTPSVAQGSRLLRPFYMACMLVSDSLFRDN